MITASFHAEVFEICWSFWFWVFLIGILPPQTASHQLTRIPVVEVILSLVAVSSSDQLQS